MQRISVQNIRRAAVLVCVVALAVMSAPGQQVQVPPPVPGPNPGANQAPAQMLPPQQLDNLVAPVALYPDRRFDYVLSAWPRFAGVGHPTHCELLGVVPGDELQLSDHYGVLADLRY